MGLPGLHPCAWPRPHLLLFQLCCVGSGGTWFLIAVPLICRHNRHRLWNFEFSCMKYLKFSISALIRSKKTKGRRADCNLKLVLEHEVWGSNQDLILTRSTIFLPRIHKTLGPRLSSLQRCSEGPSTVSYPKQNQSAPDLLNFQC